MPRLSKIGAAALAAFGWTGLSGVSVDFLVIAGGGGGGSGGPASDAAGGGGAGGYRTSAGTSGGGGSAEGKLSLNPLLSYTVTVGAGGIGGVGTDIAGTAGGSSTLSSITSAGGGRGGVYTSTSGQDGGSGGGGGTGGSINVGGGAGTANQGFAGGGCGTYPNGSGGGGGGAGAAGTAGGNTSGSLGNGGNGVASSISGSSLTYAGGGGGGGGGSNGGTGGGGAGNAAGTAGTAGTANLGAGGGGGKSSGANSPSGGNGGSGIVIISYVGAQQFSGGVVTSSGGSTIHTFTTSGTLGPITTLSASYLIVAGGGGGGSRFGGGGGAGGLLTGSGVTIDPNSTYLVTVGSGGAGGVTSGGAGTSGAGDGTSGTNSAFSMVTTTAIGGGGGGAGDSRNGLTGGSGGGGAGRFASSGGTATSGQGNAGGGSSGTATNYYGGGGGGAGAAGTAGSNSVGPGGNGTASSITGSSVTYAGGGGGGNYGYTESATRSAGGTGGGGQGGSSSNFTGEAGTVNTGGGGGGGVNDISGGLTNALGGNGGSGVVIISYAGATQLMAGGTVTISGGNVIHTFTSTGFLAPLKLVNNSLRFRSSASAYLSRTPASASNRRTWTWSGWVKRGNLASEQMLFGAGDTYVNLTTGNTIECNFRPAATSYYMTTNAVYRDPAAWYHIVVVFDSTQAVAANRAAMYVNGVQVTSFSNSGYTSMPQNLDATVNSATAHNIGRYTGASNYLDGYMTEINFIDGQALTSSSFGTINSYGVWQPITYGGSYGTNGFYLPFTNKTSTTTLGYDFSPQGNNWTTNNISLTAGSTYDSMTDVPTLTSATAANYATFNPVDNVGGATFSDGNLKVVTTNAGIFGGRATIAVSSGKFYWEMTPTNNVSGAECAIGIDSVITPITSASTGIGYSATSYSMRNSGQKVNNSTASSYGSSYTDNDVIGVALDMDAGTLTFYKNNTSQGTAFTGITGTFTPAMSDLGGAQALTLVTNFGQRPFAYTPPSGFVALNTYNL